MLEAIGARYVSTDVVVTTAGERLDGAAAEVADLPGVAAVDLATSTSVQAVVPGRTGAQYLLVDSVAEDPALRWQQLAEGALPDRPGEAAVSERVGAAIGDVLTVTTYGDEGGESTSQVTVVGVVDLGGDPSSGINGRAFVSAAQVEAWGALGPSELRIAAADGTDPQTLATAVRAALDGSDVDVRTGEEQAVQEAEALTGDALVLTLMLLVFGTVALLVAGLVIANTFAVLLAQRTRELALLRCVGATARQVRRSVLAEAALTGVAASVARRGRRHRAGRRWSRRSSAPTRRCRWPGSRCRCRPSSAAWPSGRGRRCWPPWPRPAPPPASRRWPPCARSTRRRCAPAAGCCGWSRACCSSSPASR